MNSRTLVFGGIAAALLAGTTLATASSDTGAPRRAAQMAKAAEKAIAKHSADKAVASAEAAVGLAPQNARYRAILGQAYLTAGRFASAAGAFSDALALDPANGGSALHLALAQIGSGDWGAARDTLAKFESAIPQADRGLALALAGDPATAVNVLTAAARAPGSDAKTRQNLALALALAGRWAEAKSVAAVDVSPGELDRRIVQWAAFARPKTAADQVAALLGVVPVEDGGQPVQLALARTVPTLAAVAQPVDPVDAYMPAQASAAQVAAVAPVVETPAVLATVAGVSFADRREVVQAIPIVAARPAVGTRVAAKAVPAPLIKAQPVKVALKPVLPTIAAKSPIKGDWFVQLGAFENAGVARDSWSRLVRSHRTLAGFSPNGAKISASGMNFYRLSVGGVARADAVRVCGAVRASGGRCFVRQAAGDVAAVWNRQQVASR
jgi:Flp pilus assembly protein TadD